MQALIVKGSEAHRVQGLMTQFHRARHRVYAEELGWVPERPDRLEYDPYDTAEATYFLFIDQCQLIAGSRLVPTNLPHLVADVFPGIFNLQPIIRDPSVVEWTRGFIVPEFREGGGLRLKAACCAAVMEYCLAQGYRQVGGIQDAKWLAIWARMGWQVHIHGDAVDIGGEKWLPAYFDVTVQALAGAMKWAKLDRSIITTIEAADAAA